MASRNNHNPFGDEDDSPGSFQHNGQHQPISFGGEDATLNPFANPETHAPPTAAAGAAAGAAGQAFTQGQQQHGAFSPPSSDYVSDLIDLQQGTPHPPPPVTNTSYPPPLHQTPAHITPSSTVVGRQPPPLNTGSASAYPPQPGQLQRVETFHTDTGKCSLVYHGRSFTHNDCLVLFPFSHTKNFVFRVAVRRAFSSRRRR